MLTNLLILYVLPAALIALIVWLFPNHARGTDILLTHASRGMLYK
jgi:hypothetical protein